MSTKRHRPRSGHAGRGRFAFDDTRARMLESYLGGDMIDIDVIARSCDAEYFESYFNADISTFRHLDNLSDECELLGVNAETDRFVLRRARDKRFNRVISLKSLPENLKDDPRAVSAFLTEAKIIAQLNHPSIVPIYNIYDDRNGNFHLAMKQINGKPLSGYLEKLSSLYQLIPHAQQVFNERHSLPRRLETFVQLCDAVSYVHHRNIAHCGLVPGNIVMGQYNEIYILNWGAADLLDKNRDGSRRDQAALGRILFELVFLHHDFKNPRHRFGLTVPEDLKMIVKKALDARYKSVHSLAADIRRFRADEEVSANPDTFFGSLRRKFYRSRKTMALLIVLLAALLFGGAALHLRSEVTNHKIAEDKAAVISEMYTNCLTSGMKLNSSFHDYELFVLTISRETAALLGSEKGVAGGNFYDTSDGFSEDTEPPGFEFAPAYNQKISLNSFVYHEPTPGMVPQLEGTLIKLAPLSDSFLIALWNSLPDNELPLEHPEEMKKQILQSDRMPISFIYITLENGLHLCFPYNTDYEPGYDARARPWYTETLREKRSGWSRPYRDIGAQYREITSYRRPIVSQDNEFIGVAVIDIDLLVLRRMLLESGNLGSEVKSKMLVSADGRIIVDTGRKTPAAEPDVESFFENPRLLARMWEQKVGREITHQNSGAPQELYLFYKIDTLNWLYVEKIDYQELAKYWEQ